MSSQLFGQQLVLMESSAMKYSKMCIHYALHTIIGQSYYFASNSDIDFNSIFNGCCGLQLVLSTNDSSVQQLVCVQH